MRLILIALLLVSFYYFVMLFKEAYIDYRKAKLSTVKVIGHLMPGFVLQKRKEDKRQIRYLRASYVYAKHYHEARLVDSMKTLEKINEEDTLVIFIDPRFPNEGYVNRKKAMLKNVFFMFVLTFLSLIIAALISYIICTFI